jgi:hypothetical protein
MTGYFKFFAGPHGSAQMQFIEDAGRGTLRLRDGRNDVLTYRFGDQLKEGIDSKYVRSCYIHPLFSPDGQALTYDFPQDHPHHHGVFWTWPVVKTRGQDTQTWHPASPSLRQHFVRWADLSTRELGLAIFVSPDHPGFPVAWLIRNS